MGAKDRQLLEKNEYNLGIISRLRQTANGIRELPHSDTIRPLVSTLRTVDDRHPLFDDWEQIMQEIPGEKRRVVTNATDKLWRRACRIAGMVPDFSHIPAALADGKTFRRGLITTALVTEIFGPEEE